MFESKARLIRQPLRQFLCRHRITLHHLLHLHHNHPILPYVYCLGHTTRGRLLELGELIVQNVGLVQELGCELFVRERRKQGDLTGVIGVVHPAKQLLRRYHSRGLGRNVASNFMQATPIC